MRYKSERVVDVQSVRCKVGSVILSYVGDMGDEYQARAERRSVVVDSATSFIFDKFSPNRVAYIACSM